MNGAVKRNIERFEGADCMFQLTKEECLRSQFTTLNEAQGQHLKYMPFVFTELGVAMLSSVLRSKAAREINRGIMRAFVSVRRILSVMPGTGRDVKEECSEKEARKKIGFNR